MLLPRTVEGSITKVDGAKITVFGCGIESEGTETQGTVLIRNAEDMLNYNKSEEKALEEVLAFTDKSEIIFFCLQFFFKAMPNNSASLACLRH